MAPVDDALDRLKEALEWCSVSDHAVDGGYHGRVGLDALAELKGMPEERGGTVVIDHGYYRALVAERDRYKERAEAAEAENARLTALLETTREGLRDAEQRLAAYFRLDTLSEMEANVGEARHIIGALLAASSPPPGDTEGETE